MEGYGNPRLSMDEAGYYLTTLEAAAVFIEKLEPEDLRKPEMYDTCTCTCTSDSSLTVHKPLTVLCRALGNSN